MSLLSMSPLSGLLAPLAYATQGQPELRDIPGLLAISFSLVLVVWLVAAEELDLRRDRRPAD